MLVTLIYPALIWSRTPQLTLAELMRHGYLPVFMLGIALVGLSLGLLSLRALGNTHDRTRRAFLFQCLMNNYLFLPLPIVQWLFGNTGVALLIYSSLGFEVTVWTIGLFLFAPGQTWRERLRNLVSPPLLALLTALAWVLARDGFGWSLGERGVAARAVALLRMAVDTLGAGTIGLSMLVAGSRMAVLRLRALNDHRVWWMSAIRLAAVPLVVWGLVDALQIAMPARGILLVVGAMPAAVTSVVFAERYGGDVDFIVSGLLLTHLWAVLTVPLFLVLTL